MKKRKREETFTDDPLEDTEPRNTPSALVKQQLKIFTDAKDYRYKTTVQSIDSILHDQDWTTLFKNTVQQCSTAMGIACHLTSVYLNARVNHDPDYEDVFKPNHIAQVMQRLVGRPSNMLPDQVRE